MASIVPTVKSSDLRVTVDGIARDLDVSYLIDGKIVSIAGLELVGETLSLDGLLNNSATYDVERLEENQGISTSGDWGYYAKQLAGTPSQWFKVWVRWNAEEDSYDYYLKADAGEVFSHATPYIGSVH